MRGLKYVGGYVVWVGVPWLGERSGVVIKSKPCYWTSCMSKQCYKILVNNLQYLMEYVSHHFLLRSQKAYFAPFSENTKRFNLNHTGDSSVLSFKFSLTMFLNVNI